MNSVVSSISKLSRFFYFSCLFNNVLYLYVKYASIRLFIKKTKYTTITLLKRNKEKGEIIGEESSLKTQTKTNKTKKKKSLTIPNVHHDMGHLEYPDIHNFNGTIMDNYLTFFSKLLILLVNT